MAIRHTQQRQQILIAIKLSREPLAAIQIRKLLASISVSTLYRNLEALVKSGEIFIVDGLDGKRRYVGHAWHEAEFTCQRCGKTRHIKSDTLPNNINRKMFGRQRVFVATLRASGLCAGCLRKGVL